MDQALLVDADIALGRKLVECLKNAKGLQLEAAFWWLDEDEWRFIIATPIVHKRGRLPAYRKIDDALGTRAKEFQPILDKLDVLSPSEGVITVLDVGSSGRIPLNRPVRGEGVRGVYVRGAYFYLFAPKTFIPA